MLTEPAVAAPHLKNRVWRKLADCVWNALTNLVRVSEERRPLDSGKKTTIEAVARHRDPEEGRADPVANESIAVMVPKTMEAVEDDDFRVSKLNSKDERRITIEFHLSTDFSISAPTLGMSGLRSDFDLVSDSDSASESSGESDYTSTTSSSPSSSSSKMPGFGITDRNDLSSATSIPRYLGSVSCDEQEF